MIFLHTILFPIFYSMKNYFLALVAIFLGLLGIAQAGASDLTNMLDNTSSGALGTAQEIMASDVGIFVYFGLGLAVVGAIIAIFVGFMRYMKG